MLVQPLVRLGAYRLVAILALMDAVVIVPVNVSEDVKILVLVVLMVAELDAVLLVRANALLVVEMAVKMVVMLLVDIIYVK